MHKDKNYFVNKIPKILTTKEYGFPYLLTMKGKGKMEKLLKNKKVGKKLQITFNCVIALFILTIAIAIICIVSINTKFKDFYNRPYVNSVTQMEIRRDMQYIGKQLLWATTTADEGETKNHLDEVEKYAAKLSNNVEKLTANSDNQELMQRVNEAAKTLKSSRDVVSEYAVINKNEDALDAFNGAYNDATQVMQSVLQEGGAYTDTVAENSYDSASILGTVAIAIMCVIGIFSVIFTILI